MMIDPAPDNKLSLNSIVDNFYNKYNLFLIHELGLS